MNKTAIAITILVCLTASVIYSIQYVGIELPKQQAVDKYWEAKAEQSDYDITLICPRPSETGKPVSIEDCHRQNQYHQDRELQIADHRAQISMTRAAFAAFMLGVLGTGLLTYTLIGTMNANRQLRRQNEIALDATRAEFQPYFEVYPFKFKPPLHVEETGAERYIPYFYYRDGKIDIPYSMLIKNNGKTPARDLFYILSAEIWIPTQTDTGRAFEKFLIKRQMSYFSHFIGSDKQKKIEGRLTFNIGDVEGFEIRDNKIRSDRFRVEVNIRISWSDDFSDDRRVRIAYGTGLLSKGKIPWLGHGMAKAEEYDGHEYWNNRDDINFPLGIYGGNLFKNIPPNGS